MPTREDVDLARAAIDRGFLTVKESIKCLEIQRQHEQQGQTVPLERIFVETELLTKAQLALVKDSLAKAAALRRIGHYEIISKIGTGGMGMVYKAKDLNAGRLVALKVLSPGHASNKEYVERFLREALASGQLSHPNIVQGYDAGEADGQYYFAMEYIDGITVADMLKEGRPIPEQQVLDIAIQIAKALENAEQNLIVHRDIKPDNIMITQEGTAKLADLGVARLRTRERATREKKAFGTPYYASPEQCEGTDELDSKSDMYSFGATLFHMLAGRVPFDADSPEEVMVQHLQEKPPYLKDINVQLSHGVSKIVRKLMAKDKRERYTSMSGLVKDLTLVRMGRSPRLGTRSRYDSGEYRYRSSTGSWRTRRPDKQKKLLLVVACAGIGLAALLAGLLALQWTGPDEGPGNGAITRTTDPAGNGPAPRTAAQIYFERVRNSRPRLPREEFYTRLRSVAQKYPGTEPAAQAELMADALLREIEADAEPEFRSAQTAALALLQARRYHKALRKIDEFPEKFHITRFADELAELRSRVREKARTDFQSVRNRARRLVEDKQFDQAIALYEDVIRTFGLPSTLDQARAAVKRLRDQKAAEERRQAEQARLEEQRRLAGNDREQITQALRDARELVRRYRFAGAAETIEPVGAKLSLDPSKATAGRLVKDLDRMQALFDALKAARKALKGRQVAVADRAGTTRLTGKIFSVSRRSLSIECSADGATSIRGLDWDALSIDSLRTLAKLKNGGRLDPADRCAFATLFAFCGRVDRAEAELNALKDDARDQMDAEARRSDLKLFPDAEEG
jgi:serine/threonine-protein kinase